MEEEDFMLRSWNEGSILLLEGGDERSISLGMGKRQDWFRDEESGSKRRQRSLGCYPEGEILQRWQQLRESK